MSPEISKLQKNPQESYLKTERVVQNSIWAKVTAIFAFGKLQGKLRKKLFGGGCGSRFRRRSDTASAGLNGAGDDRSSLRRCSRVVGKNLSGIVQDLQ